MQVIDMLYIVYLDLWVCAAGIINSLLCLLDEDTPHTFVDSYSMVTCITNVCPLLTRNSISESLYAYVHVFRFSIQC